MTGEETGLHVEVGFERLVIIEMVAGQVGENRRTKLKTEHALLVDSVRTHFHDRLTAAGIAHLRQHAVDVEGLGGGLERGNRANAKIVVDRSEQTDALVAVEEVLDEMRDGGLAVGSGDADDLHVAVGKLVEPLGHLGEGGAGIGDLKERDLGRHVGRHLLGDNGNRPAIDGLVDK